MPTPCGVNYLLQFLQYPLKFCRFSRNKNQKWTFILYVLINTNLSP